MATMAQSASNWRNMHTIKGWLSDQVGRLAGFHCIKTNYLINDFPQPTHAAGAIGLLDACSCL